MSEIFKTHLSSCSEFMKNSELVPLAHGLSFEEITQLKSKNVDLNYSSIVETLKDTCEHFDLLLESNITFGIPICHNSSSTFTVFSFLERQNMQENLCVQEFNDDLLNGN